MIAHLAVPALDPERPASLSPRIIEDVLRRELGFTGVVCTDCLEMAAVAEDPGTVEAAVQALAAGADLLLVSHSLATAGAAAEAILAAVRSGRIPEQRLREAAARVRALREGASIAPPPSGREFPAALAVACRGITPCAARRGCSRRCRSR